MTAVQSTTTFPAWTLQNGVISEGSAYNDPRAALKAWFVRGLAEAWRRNTGTDLANYIQSYITTQVRMTSHIGLATSSHMSPVQLPFEQLSCAEHRYLRAVLVRTVELILQRTR